MYENPQARDTVRGPPGSTIIIYKEIIRFNNNNNNNNNNNHYPTIPWDGISRQGAPLGEGFFPHFVGGIHQPKSPLLSPYPAIPPYLVRTSHPGNTDDREQIHHQLHNEPPATPTSFMDSYMSVMRKNIKVLLLFVLIDSSGGVL